MLGVWNRGRENYWKEVFVKLLLIIFLGCFPFAAQAERCVWDGVGRIVAIGDVHGDYDQFLSILLGAGLVDSELNWTGGKTHLVQLGDVLDRGPDSRRVMDLIISLEEQAPLSGGFVHFLLGNHEVMLMHTDLRYVHEGEILSHGGLKEMVRALRPEGEYGSWLSRHNAVIRINNALFVHGGISEDYSSVPLDSLNNTVRSELLSYPENLSGILSSTGPVWFRGLATDRGSAITRVLEEALSTNRADFIVIGHTVSIEGISTRFRGRVVMIDTGMSECYGGSAQYLQIEQGRYKTCLVEEV